MKVKTNIRDLLEVNRETEKLEFKEAKKQFNFDNDNFEKHQFSICFSKFSNGTKSLCGYLIALANEGGGKLILGISDKNPRKIVGTEAFLDIGDLKSKVYQKIHRRIEVEELDIENKRVLIISISSRPVGEALHFEGQYLYRIGGELRPMSPDRLKEIFNENIKDYSSQTIENIKINDLSKNAILELRRLLEKSKRVSFDIKRLNNAQLLKNLGLIRNNKFTVASIILLGKEETLREHLPFAEIRFGYKINLRQDRNQEIVIYKKAYLEYYNDIWEKINLRNHMVHIPKGLRLKEEYAFNEDSIREAINNSIIHRDYFENGSIIIQQTEDFFEIKNPGGFPKGINENNIFDETNPRNKLIAEVLFKCDFVETFGEGANKIYVNQVKYGKDSPDYSKSSKYNVTLRLNCNISSIRVAKIVDRLEEDGFELGYLELKFLNNIVRKLSTQKGIDFFVEKGIMNEKKKFIGKYKDLNDQATEQATKKVKEIELLKFCQKEKSIVEMMNHIKLKHRPHFLYDVLKPILEKQLLQLTIPDKPNNPNQKYIITKKGKRFLEKENLNKEDTFFK
jgi:ATP-dependent DNA helicase RecG